MFDAALLIYLLELYSSFVYKGAENLEPDRGRDLQIVIVFNAALLIYL